MANIIEKVVAEDLNLGHGTVSVTNPGGGALLGTKIGINTFMGDAYLNANDFDGTNAGAKIAAAIAALPSTGGTVDARGLEGAQAISSDIFSGVTKPVRLLLGAGTYTLSVAQTIAGDDVAIEGTKGTIISVTHATANMLTVTGDRFLARNLKFTAGATRTAGDIIYLSNSTYSKLENISISDGFGGIRVTAGLYNQVRDITLLGTGATWSYGLWVEDGPGGHVFENITGVSTGVISDAWVRLHRRASANKFTNLTLGGSTGTGIGVRLTQEAPTITAISRTANVVTATLSAAFYTAPFAVSVSGVTDSAFDGYFMVSTIVGNQLTWAQAAGNASSSGGAAVSPLDRPELNRFHALYVEPGFAYPSVKIEGGQDDTFTNSYFAGGLRGVDISGESTGIRIENSIFVINNREAIKTTAVSKVGAGFATLHVINNDINASSNAANNTYDAISIGAGVSDFHIIGNRIGKNNFPTAGNDARYGVAIASGASDRFTIAFNNFVNLGTGPVINQGTGTNFNIIGSYPNSTADSITLGTAPSTGTKITASVGDNTLQRVGVLANRNGGTGISALGFDVSNIVETAASKGGIGFKRQAANGVGDLRLYNRITGDSGVHFADTDVVFWAASTGEITILSQGTNRNIGLNSIGTGRVIISNGAGANPIRVAGLQVFANNAAAVAGGLTVGDLYRTNADPDPVCVVH
jgi:hypothetical protein